MYFASKLFFLGWDSGIYIYIYIYIFFLRIKKDWLDWCSFKSRSRLFLWVLHNSILDVKEAYLGVIWLNITKFEIYLRYRYYFNLFRGMRRESEYQQHHCRNSTKVWERKRKSEKERECMNFGNVITEIPATRSACLSVCAVCSKWDVLKKKKPIVAIPLPK